MRSPWPLAGLVAALALATQAPPCLAGLTLTFNGSKTNPENQHALAAQAEFSVVGAELIILLKNVATGTAIAPSDVLTAVFFDLAGGPKLSFNAATVAAGSSLVGSRTMIPLASPSTDLRLPATPGGWAFSSGATSKFPQQYGLGAAGLDRFPGATSAKGPGGPGNYGIIQAGYTSSTGYLKNKTSTPLVQSEIRFALGGLPSGFSLSPSSVTNVKFQYGTSADEPSFRGIPAVAAVPEPSTWIAAIAGATTLGLSRLRRKAAV